MFPQKQPLMAPDCVFDINFSSFSSVLQGHITTSVTTSGGVFLSRWCSPVPLSELHNPALPSEENLQLLRTAVILDLSATSVLLDCTVQCPCLPKWPTNDTQTLWPCEAFLIKLWPLQSLHPLQLPSLCQHMRFCNNAQIQNCASSWIHTIFQVCTSIWICNGKNKCEALKEEDQLPLVTISRLCTRKGQSSCLFTFPMSNSLHVPSQMHQLTFLDTLLSRKNDFQFKTAFSRWT